jgi:hypothetical protein
VKQHLIYYFMLWVGAVYLDVHDDPTHFVCNHAVVCLRASAGQRGAAQHRASYRWVTTASAVHL